MPHTAAASTACVALKASTAWAQAAAGRARQQRPLASPWHRSARMRRQPSHYAPASHGDEGLGPEGSDNDNRGSG